MRAMSSISGEENHCSNDTSNAPDSSTSEIFFYQLEVCLLGSNQCNLCTDPAG